MKRSYPALPDFDYLQGNLEEQWRRAVAPMMDEPIPYTESQQSFLILLLRKYHYDCGGDESDDIRPGVRLFRAFDNQQGIQVLNSMGGYLSDFERLEQRECRTFLDLGGGGAAGSLAGSVIAATQHTINYIIDLSVAATVVCAGVAAAAIRLRRKYSPILDNMQEGILSGVMNAMGLKMEDFEPE